MVRPMPIDNASYSVSSSPATLLAIGLFVSATILVGLCAKHARKVPKKPGPKTKDPNADETPLASHKGVTVNGKKTRFLGNEVGRAAGFGGRDSNIEDDDKEEEEEENGVWRKAILMGEKCQPPEFSGVIYYDYSGNRISEMPKSPRASPMSPLRSFNFPISGK